MPAVVLEKAGSFAGDVRSYTGDELMELPFNARV
jgi:hypothetical protein